MKEYYSLITLVISLVGCFVFGLGYSAAGFLIYATGSTLQYMELSSRLYREKRALMREKHEARMDLLNYKIDIEARKYLDSATKLGKTGSA